MAGIDLAFDVLRDIADAVDVGDRRSAEFHNQTSHQSYSRPFKRTAPITQPAQKARIHNGGVRRLQQRAFWLVSYRFFKLSRFDEAEFDGIQAAIEVE
jgi:hypothetical protein